MDNLIGFLMAVVGTVLAAELGECLAELTVKDPTSTKYELVTVVSSVVLILVWLFIFVKFIVRV